MPDMTNKKMYSPVVAKSFHQNSNNAGMAEEAIGKVLLLACFTCVSDARAVIIQPIRAVDLPAVILDTQSRLCRLTHSWVRQSY